MDRIYVFLIRNDIWIYILSGLGLFWYGSELWRARRLLRRAVFGLERETGRRLQGNALLLVLFFTAVISSVAYVNFRVQPTLPPELLLLPSPTPNIFRTPLASPTPLTDFAVQATTPTPPLAPTVTLPGAGGPGTAPGATGGNVGLGGTRPATIASGGETPEAGETVTPTAPAAVSRGCMPGVNISAPGNGDQVAGSVVFLGSASTNDFAFYKLEINGPETAGIWASLLGQVISQPVNNGLLGSGNFGGWQSGRYDVRLIVVDTTSNETGQCTIQIDIVNP